MRTRFAVLISLVFGLSADPAAAAEGAASNYFPGSYGLLLPAMAPEAGSSFTSMNLFYRAKMSRTVSGGALNLGVEINSAVTVGQLIRAWDVPSTGGSFAVGAIVPLAYADFSSSVVTGGGGSFQRSGSDFALGDIGIIPASYFWNAGNFNYNLYGVIITPTGRYDVNNDVNIGRNYWSFDTVMAMTWFNEASGTEISIIPGLMVNTENPDTNYRTGTEFHVDFLYNQFVSDELAFGLRGYAYKQVSGDSGSGALLGGFKGSSWGIGPSVNYIPTALEGKFVFSASIVRDISATNRPKADYGVVNLTWLF